MITAVHTLIYSDDPPATRAFLRDVLGWPFVGESTSEEAWLIFRTGPSELGVHPTAGEFEGESFSSPRHHQVSLMCDDVEVTQRELAAKGATFSSEIRDEGYGRTLMLHVPGADPIQIYEPRHPTAFDL
jgi:catechol 2,3-dioxygenase-like lactoylglutathione lyase family enzyme